MHLVEIDWCTSYLMTNIDHWWNDWLIDFLKACHSCTYSNFPMKNYHVALTSCSPYCSLKAIIPLFSERPIMEHLSQHGFINYFGMQRFGTSNISTHKVFTQGVCTCRTFSTGCSKVIVRYTMLDIVLFIYLFGVLLFQSILIHILWIFIRKSFR